MTTPRKPETPSAPLTPQVGKEKDLVADRMEAEVREADARLKVLEAQAKARKAKADMDEISGLAAAKERIKKDVAEMKRQAAADYAETKHELELSMKALKADIQRVHDRYTAWDTARERQFYARLDAADAKLAEWTAAADRMRAEDRMQRHDDLATLKEKIALARARAAEAREAKYSAKSQAALEDAAHRFDEAYDAAAGRYEKS